MQPFPHQNDLIQGVRSWTPTKSRICIQSATGSGKTVIACEITRRSMINDLRVWFVAPRNKLVNQASKTLKAFGIPHGQITATNKESRAFRVHVVSKDTLMRRCGKTINPPDILIFDECHIALDQQIKIYMYLLSMTARPLYVLGLTATPERLDGRGLSDLYQVLVEGLPIHELVEMGFLSTPEFYSPELKGAEKLHRSGTDVDTKEFDDLCEERAVYGQAVDLYEKHRPGEQAIMFSASVAIAKKVAKNFRDRDHNFEAVDGGMSKKMIADMFDHFDKEEITGFTSCELLTYGVDLPAVQYIGMLRRTFSVPLNKQMNGRGLRIAPGKDSCVIMDQANNYDIHGHPLDPHEWNFYGKKKRKIPKPDPLRRQMLCPHVDMMYCMKSSCVGCKHNKDGVKSKKEMHIVEADFKKIEAPVKLNERPPEEKRDIQIQINQAVEATKGSVQSGPIGKLLDIAEELGRQPMWVYWKLSEGRISVNVPLLHEIGRQMNKRSGGKSYKNVSGWAYYKGEEIKKKLRRG